MVAYLNMRPHVSNMRPRVSDVQPRVSDVRPRVSDVRPRVLDVRPRFSNVRPRVSNLWAHFLDVRPRVWICNTNSVVLIYHGIIHLYLIKMFLTTISSDIFKSHFCLSVIYIVDT